MLIPLLSPVLDETAKSFTVYTTPVMLSLGLSDNQLKHLNQGREVLVTVM